MTFRGDRYRLRLSIPWLTTDYTGFCLRADTEIDVSVTKYFLTLKFVVLGFGFRWIYFYAKNRHINKPPIT